MTRRRRPREEAARGPRRDRRGLTNGTGTLRSGGLTNGLGRVNGTGLTNGRGATNGLTNGLRGRTNGLTNGLTNGMRGRTNGLTNGIVNGVGRTNGMRGRTNGLMRGRGATNGAGVINGLVNGTLRRGLRANRFGVISQKDLRLGLSLVVLFLLLLGPFYLLLSTPPPTPPTRIVPDGSFADWAGIDFLDDAVASPDANIVLRSYSAFEENGFLSFGIRVAGIPLGDSTGFDGFYVFIDKDANSATGFEAREIGADYMVAIRGGNNTVSFAALFGFRSSTPRDDWSGWEQLESVRTGVSAAGLEVQLDPGAIDFGPRRSFLLAGNDYAGNETIGSVHFDLVRRALLVRQSPASPVVSATGQPFASLTFTAFGGSIDVTRVALTKVRGPGTLAELNNFAVPKGSPIARDVSVTFTPADAGNPVVARVDPTVVQVSGAVPVPVTVDGPDIVAYLGSAPTDHRIDGYFGEWTLPPPATQLAYDATPVADRNVDVQQHGANRTGSTAFVYADVVGRIFGGSGTPERFERAVPGGPGGQPSPPGPRVPRKGEDVFRAYIDVDTALPNGTEVLGVRADFYIEVRGVYGRVVSMQAFAWTGVWRNSSRGVAVANDRSRMEASIDLAGVTTGAMAMSIETTDWNLRFDITDVFTFLGVRGGGGTRGDSIPVPLHGTGAATAVAQPLSAAPTVDGSCADSAYSAAGTFSSTGISGKVGTFASFVYICIEATSDTTDDGIGDFARIYFDRDHDGGTGPNAGDRRFAVSSGSTTNESRRGNDARTAWVTCTPSASPSVTQCHGGNRAAGAFSTNEIYEFKVHYLDVWNTTSPSANQRAGFAVRIFDSTSGTTWTWGSTSPPADLDPSTWGHLDIPEFQDLIVPVAVVGIIYFVARRRRRAPGP